MGERLDATQLAPLPSADDEARAVVTTLGQAQSTILLDESATEQEVKRQAPSEYGVLHFAAHGIVSTRFPARSALVLRPAGDDDGLFRREKSLEIFRRPDPLVQRPAVARQRADAAAANAPAR